MLEFPKILYKNGDPLNHADDTFQVHNAEEEASARVRGYLAPPVGDRSPDAPSPAEHLEYPKFLYLDGKVDQDARLVKDADAEAVARDAGYLAVGESADAEPEASDESGDKPKRGRKPKQS